MIDPVAQISLWIQSVPGLSRAISDITAFLNSIAY
ncbi:hypothetical protein GRU3_16 [Gordonia phage GRU3]|uniref:Uncharacterized protein n=1 Tax=Gordonia phage GRU3 TaxID=1647473 RepID=A0A0K0N608_9CAUD|nr:hypothetical protein BH785_gp16 [Gordonia phage GRU3]AKJ72265.1 hypothetical protein GRU3_16 [Gordonia phage GRU3]